MRKRLTQRRSRNKAASQRKTALRSTGTLRENKVSTLAPIDRLRERDPHLRIFASALRNWVKLKDPERNISSRHQYQFLLLMCVTCYGDIRCLLSLDCALITCKHGTRWATEFNLKRKILLNLLMKRCMAKILLSIKMGVR